MDVLRIVYRINTSVMGPLCCRRCILGPEQFDDEFRASVAVICDRRCAGLLAPLDCHPGFQRLRILLPKSIEGFLNTRIASDHLISVARINIFPIAK